MAENEYLDSSKARRWQSVAQAIRDGCSDDEITDRVQDCFYRTLRAIAKDLPLAEMIAVAAHDPDELARMCDGIEGGLDVKDFLHQAATTCFETENMLETFLVNALNNCLFDIPYIAADLDDGISISQGSQATRSAHPTFLKKMSRLLGEVSGRTIDVQLPFEGLTKGEVVRALTQANLRDVAHASASCVGYPLRQMSAKSCGLCPACIFRRVALHAAEIEEPKTTYHYDLLDPKASKLSHRKIRYLLAFLNQIDSLSSVADHQLPISVSKHLSRTELIRAGDSQQPFIQLYAKYHREWLSFIRTAKAKSCQWCDLIDLPAKAA
jgi:hypothetical protein